MAIEREIDYSKSIRDAGVSGKRKENQFPSSSGKEVEDFYSTRVLVLRDRVAAPKAKARISHPKTGGTSRLLAS